MDRLNVYLHYPETSSLFMDNYDVAPNKGKGKMNEYSMHMDSK